MPRASRIMIFPSSKMSGWPYPYQRNVNMSQKHSKVSGQMRRKTYWSSLKSCRTDVVRSFAYLKSPVSIRPQVFSDLAFRQGLLRAPVLDSKNQMQDQNFYWSLQSLCLGDAHPRAHGFGPYRQLSRAWPHPFVKDRTDCR